MVSQLRLAPTLHCILTSLVDTQVEGEVVKCKEVNCNAFCILINWCILFIGWGGSGKRGGRGGGQWGGGHGNQGSYSGGQSAGIHWN